MDTDGIPEEKYWSFPSSDGILEKILSVFDGERIEIDPTLRTSEEYFKDLREELVARKYSPKTVKSYIHYNKDFLGFSSKMPREIT